MSVSNSGGLILADYGVKSSIISEVVSQEKLSCNSAFLNETKILKIWEKNCHNSNCTCSKLTDFL